MSGIEFELHCLRLFLRQGWEASVTKGSGDQGADIIARKGGKIVVVQCKHYGGSVGNAAVQEVYGAKAHVGADIACVVSNAPFTPGAKALAASTKVMLLNEEALQGCDATFGVSDRCPVCDRPARAGGKLRYIICGGCGTRIDAQD